MKRKISSLQIEAINELNRMKVDTLLTFILRRLKDGTEKRVVYKKISDTQVEIIRHYEYS